MLKDVVEKWGGVQVEALDAYKDIFHLGEGYIQKENEPKGSFKSNPIAYYKNDNEKHGHYRIMFEDKFEEIYNNELKDADFCIMNGLTYFGIKNLAKHSSKMYAMIFDLDGVTDDTLNNFFFACFNEEFLYYPLPNYVALSGHGVHLYYVFEEPVNLYPYIKFQLKEFKYALTQTIWNKNTSTEVKVQKQGIHQPFKILGGKTKKDAPISRVEVYRTNNHPYTLDVLNRYTPEPTKVDQLKLFEESQMSLEEAQKKYPEWYENRISKGNKEKKTWICNRALYDWWLRKIKDEKNGASYGHRYFCIMALAIYATKCDIDKDELEKDAYELIPYLNGLNIDEPFTEEDVASALECCDPRYRTFPINDIVKITGIEIQKNKRNYQKQSDHLEEARAIRDIRQKRNGTNWDDNNGRKPKKDIVEKWKLDNPNGTKSQCIKETGLSKPTVYKWWNSEEKATIRTENSSMIKKESVQYNANSSDIVKVVDKKKHKLDNASTEELNNGVFTMDDVMELYDLIRNSDNPDETFATFKELMNKKNKKM